MKKVKEKKQLVKIFRVVSLGDEIRPHDIEDLLTKKITLDPKRPDTFFTVSECIEEEQRKEISAIETINLVS
jgi:hypothetical protein